MGLRQWGPPGQEVTFPKFLLQEMSRRVGSERSRCRRMGLGGRDCLDGGKILHQLGRNSSPILRPIGPWDWGRGWCLSLPISSGTQDEAGKKVEFLTYRHSNGADG